MGQISPLACRSRSARVCVRACAHARPCVCVCVCARARVRVFALKNLGLTPAHVERTHEGVKREGGGWHQSIDWRRWREGRAAGSPHQAAKGPAAERPTTVVRLCVCVCVCARARAFGGLGGVSLLPSAPSRPRALALMGVPGGLPQQPVHAWRCAAPPTNPSHAYPPTPRPTHARLAPWRREFVHTRQPARLRATTRSCVQTRWVSARACA